MVKSTLQNKVLMRDHLNPTELLMGSDARKKWAACFRVEIGKLGNPIPQLGVKSSKSKTFFQGNNDFSRKGYRCHSV